MINANKVLLLSKQLLCGHPSRLEGSLPMRRTSARTANGPFRFIARSALAASLMALVTLTGCGADESGVQIGGLTKIRVGYIGITCEAPLFAAQEMGFFKEEGLDVEMVRC